MKANAKVLLVEDDPIAVRHLKNSLLRMGYQLTGIARSGEEVIKRVEESRPEIILMDINLGGKIDGIHAAEIVHAQVNIPVIYLTANSDTEMFERAKLTDPYAYLVKPYEMYQLQIAIEIALFRHTLEKQLQESENRYRTIFEVSDNAMMLVDENSKIIMVNEQFENITGFTKATVEKTKRWDELFDNSELSKIEQILSKADEDKSAPRKHFESILIDRHGNAKNVYTNIKKIPDSKNRIISMNDISDLKQAEQEIRQLNRELNAINKGLSQEIILREKVEKQLRHKATHDHLTGLPNRVLLFDRIKQAFSFEARHKTLVALMILDLDNFKNINDTLGHLSGDILLKKIASMLQKCMRQYDTVGRLGGDEFVIIINDVETIQDIIAFTKKIQAVFQEPFDILGYQAYVTTSIGIAVYPLHGSTIENLLIKADMAMYVAKNAGRNTFRLFDESMDAKDSSKKSLRTKRRLSLMGADDREEYLTHVAAPLSKKELTH